MDDREHNDGFQIKEDTFYRLYTDFYPSLVQFARKILKSEQNAEDLVQDVFVRLWETRETTPVIENISLYLYQAVKYRCLNELRDLEKHRQIEKSVSPKDESYFDMLYTEQEVIRHINEAIASLPPRCKEIFVKAMDGLSNKEIATQLEISEETVKKQKKIARKILREKINAWLLLLFVIHQPKLHFTSIHKQ